MDITVTVPDENTTELATRVPLPQANVDGAVAARPSSESVCITEWLQRVVDNEVKQMTIEKAIADL